MCSSSLNYLIQISICKISVTSPHYTYTSLNNYSSITARIFHWNPYFSIRYPLLIILWFQRHESAQVYSITLTFLADPTCARLQANLTHFYFKSLLVYFFCCIKYLAARTFSASLNQSRPPSHKSCRFFSHMHESQQVFQDCVRSRHVIILSPHRSLSLFCV
jgi:hypothetical protein